MKRQPAFAASSRAWASSLAESAETPMDGPVRKPESVSLTALDTSEALPTDASTFVGARQIWGAAGYSRRNPLERHVRDARMFAIAGGTAQILRNQVAASILGRRFPQTRDGYVDLPDAAK